MRAGVGRVQSTREGAARRDRGLMGHTTGEPQMAGHGIWMSPGRLWGTVEKGKELLKRGMQ